MIHSSPTTGFKGFSYDTKKKKLYCLKSSFEVGVRKRVKGKVVFCRNGYHFCTHLREVLAHYGLHNCKFYGKVKTGLEYEFGAGKNITRYLTVTELMPNTDVLKALDYKATGTKILKSLRNTDYNHLFNTPAVMQKYMDKLEKLKKKGNNYWNINIKVEVIYFKGKQYSRLNYQDFIVVTKVY